MSSAFDIVAPHRIAARIAALEAAVEARTQSSTPEQLIDNARAFERYLLSDQPCGPAAGATDKAKRPRRAGGR